MNTSKNLQEIDTSTERVDEIKLPPLPSPFGIVDPSDANKCGIYDLKDLHDYAKAYATAALQSQDREDALIETILDACDEWSGYVEVDNAPRTLREHVKLAIDHARRIDGEGE